jgi:hypothetical protein
MNFLIEIDTKQTNFCSKLTNKLYIDLCASVPLREFISIYVSDSTLGGITAPNLSLFDKKEH